MRLLHVRTKKLKEFFDNAIPPYAILSHVWGKDEVLFSHIQRKGYKGGSFKVDSCLAQAAVDGIKYVWIDTLCIDKSSSAELSEAINSMFEWYRAAQVCYAYLNDVPDTHRKKSDICLEGSAFRGVSGLPEELLAPLAVHFFSKSWLPIGRKGLSSEGGYEDDDEDDDEGPDENEESHSFHRVLSEITGIPTLCLEDYTAAFWSASIAEKMSWAAGRLTTRKEDRAYSLLGIFGVNMPLLYGEGEKAFIRLQEEIMRVSEDQTLFVWGYGQEWMARADGAGLFASSPDDFASAGGLKPYLVEVHYTMTNKGLQVNLGISRWRQSSWSFFALLDCYEGEAQKRVALPLCYDETRGTLHRDITRAPWSISSSVSSSIPAPIYISRHICPDVKLANPGFSIIGDNINLQQGITACSPAIWTAHLKNSSSIPWLCTGAEDKETILFAYTGGQVSAFMAKLDYEFLSEQPLDGPPRLKPISLTCSFRSLSEHESLEPVLLEYPPESNSLSSKHRWGDVLDVNLDWRERLALEDGIWLSARLHKDLDHWKLFLVLDSEVQKKGKTGSRGRYLVVYAAPQRPRPLEIIPRP